MNGPTSVPSRLPPARVDNARPRCDTGTSTVTNACRAIWKVATDRPARNTPTPSAKGVLAIRLMVRPTALTPAAISIARRSPSRSTAHPAGRLPTSWLTTASPAMNPA